MKEIVTIDGQTIYDIAVQEYGSADGVGQLIRDNPFLSFGGSLAGGTVLQIDPSKIIDKKVVDAFREMLPPATRMINANNWLLAEGYWNNGGVWDNSEYWHNTY